jgi:WD40 repeat protein
VPAPFPTECKGFLVGKNTKLASVYGTYAWKQAFGVACLSLSPDGHELLTGSGNSLWVWNTESGSVQNVVRCGSEVDSVLSVVFTPDKKRALSGHKDHLVKLWDLDTKKELFTLKGHDDNVSEVACSADGKRGLSISWDGGTCQRV